MPAKTAKQRRAMHAAAAGRSTIGIPKSVGDKFVGERKHKKKKKTKKKRKKY
jgi:hypothetical protein